MPLKLTPEESALVREAAQKTVDRSWYGVRGAVVGLLDDDAQIVMPVEGALVTSFNNCCADISAEVGGDLGERLRAYPQRWWHRLTGAPRKSAWRAERIDMDAPLPDWRALEEQIVKLARCPVDLRTIYYGPLGGGNRVTPCFVWGASVAHRLDLYTAHDGRIYHQVGYAKKYEQVGSFDPEKIEKRSRKVAA